jgi:hypothetical protein
MLLREVGSGQDPYTKKGHRHDDDALAFLRATRLPSNSRLPAVNIQAARTRLWGNWRARQFSMT